MKQRSDFILLSICPELQAFGLDKNQMLVYGRIQNLALMSDGDNGARGYAYVSQNTLAKELTLSVDQIKHARTALRRKGLIMWARGGQTEGSGFLNYWIPAVDLEALNQVLVNMGYSAKQAWDAVGTAAKAQKKCKEEVALQRENFKKSRRLPQGRKTGGAPTGGSNIDPTTMDYDPLQGINIASSKSDIVSPSKMDIDPPENIKEKNRFYFVSSFYDFTPSDKDQLTADTDRRFIYEKPYCELFHADEAKLAKAGLGKFWTQYPTPKDMPGPRQAFEVKDIATTFRALDRSVSAFDALYESSGANALAYVSTDLTALPPPTVPEPLDRSRVPLFNRLQFWLCLMPWYIQALAVSRLCCADIVPRAKRMMPIKYQVFIATSDAYKRIYGTEMADDLKAFYRLDLPAIFAALGIDAEF